MKQFVCDRRRGGAAGRRRRSDFNGLHFRKHDDEVQFYAFDMLVSDGEDLRKLPLSMRKTKLARLWRAASTTSTWLRLAGGYIKEVTFLQTDFCRQLQLKVCNLIFSELSACRSNTCVARPLKVAGFPSLSLPLALHFGVP